MLSTKLYRETVLGLNFDPLRQWIQKTFLFIKKYQTLWISLGLAYFISDLILIKSYYFLFPDKELAPLNVSYQANPAVLSPLSHQMIWKNNIFHTGPLPAFVKSASNQSSEPVLSDLPFTLKGTIIHANPNRSVASIQTNKDNKSRSYQIADLIEAQAEIRKIERGKVIFFNQNNNRLEYLMIPEEQTRLNISYKDSQPKKPSLKASSSPVKNLGNNKYEANRSDLKQYLQKLPEILSQARVVPHTQGGEVVGFRFVSIDKGSVFEDLGFQKGHIIKQVNGSPVTSAEEALQLFEELKAESRFELLVEENGKPIKKEYTVNNDAPIF